MHQRTNLSILSVNTFSIMPTTHVHVAIPISLGKGNRVRPPRAIAADANACSLECSVQRTAPNSVKTKMDLIGRKSRNLLLRDFQIVEDRIKIYNKDFRQLVANSQQTFSKT